MQDFHITDDAPLNWDDARLFLAVARAGQILAAARRLGISQATLSRRVAALERAVGAKLVVRRTHGTELSEAGAALLASLERVEAEFLAAGAAAGTARVAGDVRVGAPDGFGVGFLAPRLGALGRAHPDIRVQLVPAPRVSLSRREADIAVLVGAPESGRLVTRRLTDYTLGLYAAPAYLAGGAPETVADLARHRLVGYVEDLVASPALDYAREILATWRSAVEVSSALGQLEAVRAGAGIGVLHDYLAAGHADLVPVLPMVRVRRAYWLAVHENLADVPRVRAVVDFVAAAVRAAPPFVAT